MAFQIIHDTESDVAVLVDNSTDWAFGPVIHGPDADEKAHDWVDFLLGPDDVSLLTVLRMGYEQLSDVYATWLSDMVCAACGVLLEGADTIHVASCKHYRRETP